jgi:hypothetical protein
VLQDDSGDRARRNLLNNDRHTPGRKTKKKKEEKEGKEGNLTVNSLIPTDVSENPNKIAGKTVLKNKLLSIKG